MLRWIPIVHDDGLTVGVARFDGDVPVDVHWVGSVARPVSPSLWQGVLAAVAPEHRGSGEGWMIRACVEALGGLDGTAFDEVRIEEAAEPEGADDARLVQRTVDVADRLRERILETRIVYASVAALAAAIERTLSEYDHAVLATAIDTSDLPAWCQAVAERWWAQEPALRGAREP
ncbi:MAG: hypothetical protein H6737_13265 [Alphaproteobacteria bacterium]|nr:hypothetical protein [Alphaproteobacteria bacterium]